MSKYSVVPTGNERFFNESDIIVSKTNLKGHITYANNVFLDIAGFSETEIVNKPHSLIRHPNMPRCIFKFLWDTIEAKNEIFAYVINMAKNGDHYWVFAHVTPTLDADDNVVGFHSSRRVPERKSVDAIEGIYKDLLAVEAQHSNAKDGMNKSYDALLQTVGESGMTYDELIFAI